MFSLQRPHFLLIVSILSLAMFTLFGVPRVEAVQASMVRIQLNDGHCTTSAGTARGNPSGDNIWSSYASDGDDWDPDCVRVDIDNTVPAGYDIRFCIQSDDDGGIGGIGGGVSNTACTPWASEGGGWSAWAADPDKWAYDRLRIKVDTQALTGRYISNYRIGFQNSRATGDDCTVGTGTATYTPYMNAGGGWGSYAPDALNEGSIACSRINLNGETITGNPCTFNGNNVNSGSSVTAYQASSVPYGSTCTSQTRTCTNGSLSGSYAYSSCSVAAPSPCTFNGNSIAHNASVTAYQTATVPYGSSCTSETRTCNNNSLSGSYAYSSCSVTPAANCTFNGNTVLHGNSVTAYQTATVPYGSTCTSQSRTCNDSLLSGTYTNSSCSVNPPQDCNLNGTFVPHGTSYTFYDRTPLPYGAACGAGNSVYAQSRTCNDSLLSGSGSFNVGTCTVDASQQPASITGNGFVGSATVRSGSYVRLQWDGVNADSCSLSGAGGFVSTSTPTLPISAGAVSGFTWVQVNQKTTFTLTCSKSSPSSSSTKTTTINMVPSTQEI